MSIHVCRLSHMLIELFKYASGRNIAFCQFEFQVKPDLLARLTCLRNVDCRYQISISDANAFKSACALRDAWFRGVCRAAVKCSAENNAEIFCSAAELFEFCRGAEIFSFDRRGVRAAAEERRG